MVHVKRTYTERQKKDLMRTRNWNLENKERKSLLNKTWRLNNNGAEYLRRYRQLKKLYKVLSDYCFYYVESK